jgi:hypothetical protein
MLYVSHPHDAIQLNLAPLIKAENELDEARWIVGMGILLSDVRCPSWRRPRSSNILHLGNSPNVQK